MDFRVGNRVFGSTDRVLGEHRLRLLCHVSEMEFAKADVDDLKRDTTLGKPGRDVIFCYMKPERFTDKSRGFNIKYLLWNGSTLPACNHGSTDAEPVQACEASGIFILFASGKTS